LRRRAKKAAGDRIIASDFIVRDRDRDDRRNRGKVWAALEAAGVEFTNDGRANEGRSMRAIGE
jgi:hypothetical protein